MQMFFQMPFDGPLSRIQTTMDYQLHNLLKGNEKTRPRLCFGCPPLFFFGRRRICQYIFTICGLFGVRPKMSFHSMDAARW